MKKLFFAIMAAAAILTVSACDNDGDKKGKGNEEDNFVGIVTIDGEFEEWGSLEDVVTVICPTGEGVTSTALKTASFVGDERYIYVYFEYEINQVHPLANVDMMFDIDCNYSEDDEDVLTGGATWLWNDGAGYEYLIENPGFIKKDGEGNLVIDDFAGCQLFAFTGQDGKDAWEAGGELTEKPASGFAMGAGKIEGNIAMVEFRILRDRLEIDGPKVRLGINTTYCVPVAEYEQFKEDFPDWNPYPEWAPQGEDLWKDNGHLPQPMGENDLAEMLEITVPVDE